MRSRRSVKERVRPSSQSSKARNAKKRWRRKDRKNVGSEDSRPSVGHNRNVRCEVGCAQGSTQHNNGGENRRWGLFGTIDYNDLAESFSFIILSVFFLIIFFNL